MDTATIVKPIDEREGFARPPGLLPSEVPASAPTAPGATVAATRPSALAPYRPPRWTGRPAALMAAARPVSRSLATAMRAAFVLEVERGTPFLFVPVFLAVGAIGYFSLAWEPAVWMLMAAAVAAVAIRVVTRHHPLLMFPGAALALVLAGLVLGGIETARHQTSLLGGEISTTLTGRVVEMDLLDSGRTRLVIDVTATERPVLRYVPQRVRVSARTVPPGLRAGSMVKGLARLQPPSGPVRPGSYDFSFESYFDGIGATGFFMRGPELLAHKDPLTNAQAFTEMVANARLAIADRVRERIGGAEGDIAAALMVGVRAGIPEEVNEAMRKAGLYHIISISGLHMALVAGVFMGFLRVCFALFPGFSSRHPVKKYAAGAAILAIAGYLFISGGEVAAERSFIMLAVMLAAVLFDRAALTMRNLAISALVVILWSPHEIVGPSFQMSFAATAALVGAYAWWSERPERKARSRPTASRGLLRNGIGRVSTMTGALIATSLIAGLATAVFGVYHFNRVSPLGLASNLAAMPVVSLIVMPFAVLAALAMPFGIEGPFLDVMGRGLSAMIAISRWFSERSPLDTVGQISGLSVILFAIALVVATMATTILRVLALPIALAGMVALLAVPRPDIFISEDSKLVGVALRADAIAIDRERPNAFTLANWKRTLGVDSVAKPAKESSGHPVESKADRFVCNDEQCVIVLKDGGRLVHTGDAEVARMACRDARVIVLDDPTTDLRCADPSIAIIGARSLALFGSAVIELDGLPPGAPPRIEFAKEGNARPWNRHRVYSRAARGLPAFVPKPKTDQSAAATDQRHSTLPSRPVGRDRQ